MYQGLFLLPQTDSGQHISRDADTCGSSLAILGCVYLPLANQLIAKLAVEPVVPEFAWIRTSD